MVALFAVLTVAAAPLGITIGCGEPQQAARHQIDVYADGGELRTIETNEGYAVTVERVVIRTGDIEFTAGGTPHDDGEVARFLESLFLSTAHAHPNHAAGGEVAGVLDGPTAVEWRPEQQLEVGEATMLEGSYAGYNFAFVGDETEGEPPDASLADGAMARIEATATPPDDSPDIPFGIDIEYFDQAQITGGAFAAEISENTTDGIGLVLLAHDEWSDRTLFDDVQFSRHVPSEDERAEIPSDSTAHQLMRNAVNSHEFYSARPIDD